MEWKKIEDANKEIKQTEIKRRYKDKNGNWQEIKSKYVEVKERVIAFRKLFPLGQIIPEISFSENYVICDCTVLDENGHILAKGHAREIANKEFALENCETSACGRALGFVGLGISTSIASAEEIQNVKDNQIFDEPIKADLVKMFKELYTKAEQVNILNILQLTDANDMDSTMLNKYVNIRKYGKK